MYNNKEYLGKLRERVAEDTKQVVALFRQGADQEGYNELVGMLERLEKLLELSVKEGKDAASIEEINLHLAQTLKAMEQGDPVLVADYLEYQVLPAVITL